MLRRAARLSRYWISPANRRKAERPAAWKKKATAACVGEDGGGGGSCGIINPWHWLLFGGSRPAAVLTSTVKAKPPTFAVKTKPELGKSAFGSSLHWSKIN
jgi:hypothetical protein